MIFLIDTTTDYLGLGIWDGRKLYTKTMKANNNVNKKIVSIIDGFLNSKKVARKDLKFIGVINGPGAFTGVRTGITIANAMSYALKIPIYSINSLVSQLSVGATDSVVQGRATGSPLQKKGTISIISATKEEVYYLRFSGKIVKSDIQVVNVFEINRELSDKYVVVGQIREDQIERIKARVTEVKPRDRIWSLMRMIIDGKIKSQKQINPLYVKKPNITIKKTTK